MTDDPTPMPLAQPHVLREYALIADGERGGLIGPRGELAWLCMPRWDSPAVFAALIGGEGTYKVSPVNPWFVWGGSYEPGTLIWRSRWTTSAATVECREALAFPGETGTVTVLRRIIPKQGEVPVRLDLAPRHDYGMRQPEELHRDDNGVWTARLGSLHMRLTGAAEAQPDAENTLHAEFHVPPGNYHDLVLEIADHPLPATLPDAQRLWRATEDSWREQVPEFANTLAPADVEHSYAVLRGLTSSSGAMVAAATTSLPERSGAGGDYDYRYSWIRDQSYVGQAVAAAGSDTLLDSAAHFISERLLADGPKLRPAYRVDGTDLPQQQQLPLSGYPGGTDRIGNQVRNHFQLDTFGEAMLLLAAAASRDRLESEGRRAMSVAADAIAENWTEQGTGVWELDPRHWTHSRLICVAGLRAAARQETPDLAARWSGLADRIVSATAETGLHPSGRWQRSPGDEKVDAALLLPALRGGVPADDPRSLATLQTVRSHLSEDGYVYRFRHDERRLADSEGAFLLCGFLTAMAEHQVGLDAPALRRFERNRAACGPPGLFTEEYDVVQRQLRGNLPQAFVHGLMIESATRLAQIDDTAMEGDAR